MANTYTLISSVTVGAGGASSIDFTSIPSTYTDLMLIFSPRATASAGNRQSVFISFNGSTATTYISKRLYEEDGGVGYDVLTGGSTTTGASGRSIGVVPSNQISYVFGTSSIYIPSYANTSQYKTAMCDLTAEVAATNAGDIWATGTVWQSTSAINQITIIPNTSSSWVFTQYSTPYLYGISSS